MHASADGDTSGPSSTGQNAVARLRAVRFVIHASPSITELIAVILIITVFFWLAIHHVPTAIGQALSQKRWGPAHAVKTEMMLWYEEHGHWPGPELIESMRYEGLHYMGPGAFSLPMDALFTDDARVLYRAIVADDAPLPRIDWYCEVESPVPLQFVPHFCLERNTP